MKNFYVFLPYVFAFVKIASCINKKINITHNSLTKLFYIRVKPLQVPWALVGGLGDWAPCSWSPSLMRLAEV